MIDKRPSYRERVWLHTEHPEVPCWRCARCYNVGGTSNLCVDDYGNYMCVPYNAEHNSCMFVWDLAAAAREAHTRLAYMGYDALPPMVKDVYAILDQALQFELRKI